MDFDRFLRKSQYDFLTRIMPGAVAVLLLPVAVGSSFSGLVSWAVGDSVGLGSSVSVGLLVLGLSSYVVGGLLSALASDFESWLVRRGHLEHQLLEVAMGSGKGDIGLKLRKRSDVARISGPTDAHATLMRWYAEDLERCVTEEEKSDHRDRRARPRFQSAVAIAVGVASLLSLLIGAGGQALVLAMICGLSWRSFLRQRRIFHSDLLRRIAAHTQPVIDTSRDSAPTCFERWQRAGRPLCVVVAGETNLFQLREMGDEVESGVAQTPFGAVHWDEILLEEGAIVLVRRYLPGTHRRWLPHAYMWWAAANDVRIVVAVSGVGTLQPEEYPQGSVALVGDFIDLRGSGRPSFSDVLGVEVFARLNPPYCSMCTDRIQDAVGIAAPTAVCATTLGPRIETAAEVRALSRLGADLVGTRLSTEAVLAREAGLCFVPVVAVLNVAEGDDAAGGEQRLEKLKQGLDRAALDASTEKLLRSFAGMDSVEDCGCKASLNGLVRKGAIRFSLTELEVPPSARKLAERASD